MQYCTKCQNICEDSIVTCPHCKRKLSLREAKENDLVYLFKTSEYESGEIDQVFTQNAVNFEIRPYKTGIVSSVYDSTYMPTDKVIYVEYKDLQNAKRLLNDMKQEDEDQPVPTASKKTIATQVISIIAFMVLVTIVVLATDAFTSFLKTLF